MLNRRDAMILLIVLLCVSLLLDEQSYSEYYPPLPQVYSLEYFTATSPYFRIMCRFDMDTFNNVLCPPLQQYMKWPYNWAQTVSAECTIYPGRMKARRLDCRNRLFRFLLYCCDAPISMLVPMFGDKEDTVRKDLVFIAQMLVKVFGPRCLTRPDPHSAEYDQLVGRGLHGHIFTHSVYNVDTTHMIVQRPVRSQRDWYCGHHRVHCAKFLTVHDLVSGACRFVSDLFPGHNNDIFIHSHSLLGQEPLSFVQPNHSILADGIFARIGWPMLCRYTHRDPNQLTANQNLYNRMHSAQRILVENFYGRHKKLWPGIMTCFNLDLSKCGLFFRATTILTNLLIEHQSPLRAA